MVGPRSFGPQNKVQPNYSTAARNSQAANANQDQGRQATAREQQDAGDGAGGEENTGWRRQVSRIILAVDSRAEDRWAIDQLFAPSRDSVFEVGKGSGLFFYLDAGNNELGSCCKGDNKVANGQRVMDAAEYGNRYASWTGGGQGRGQPEPTPLQPRLGTTGPDFIFDTGLHDPRFGGVTAEQGAAQRTQLVPEIENANFAPRELQSYFSDHKPIMKPVYVIDDTE
ncbi:unnamed protein product [Amoebophrya sp. A120]|nr:unnamed protein product [Amoebophrya sp. A120]|eukprot:GSA120T00013223001.1